MSRFKAFGLESAKMKARAKDSQSVQSRCSLRQLVQLVSKENQAVHAFLQCIMVRRCQRLFQKFFHIGTASLVIPVFRLFPLPAIFCCPRSILAKQRQIMALAL